MDKKNKLKNFINFYADKVKHLISSVDEDSLKKIINLILQTSKQKKKYLYVEMEAQHLFQVIIFVTI